MVENHCIHTWSCNTEKEGLTGTISQPSLSINIFISSIRNAWYLLKYSWVCLWRASCSDSELTLANSSPTAMSLLQNTQMNFKMAVQKSMAAPWWLSCISHLLIKLSTCMNSLNLNDDRSTASRSRRIFCCISCHSLALPCSSFCSTYFLLKSSSTAKSEEY